MWLGTSKMQINQKGVEWPRERRTVRRALNSEENSKSVNHNLS